MLHKAGPSHDPQFVMTNRSLFAAACLVVLGLTIHNLASAANFRMYTANKLLQQRQVTFVRNTDEPGCHNLIKKRRIYRVAQIGFETCTIYAVKDCEAGSEIPVSWKNKKDPTLSFTRGARWFLPGKQGSKMRSWKCEGES